MWLARILLLIGHSRYWIVIFNLDVHHWISSSFHSLEDYLVRYWSTIPCCGIYSFHTTRCSISLPHLFLLGMSLHRIASIVSFIVEIVHADIATLNNLTYELISWLTVAIWLYKVRNYNLLLLSSRCCVLAASTSLHSVRSVFNSGLWSWLSVLILLFFQSIAFYFNEVVHQLFIRLLINHQLLLVAIIWNLSGVIRIFAHFLLYYEWVTIRRHSLVACSE